MFAFNNGGADGMEMEDPFLSTVVSEAAVFENLSADEAQAVCEDADLVGELVKNEIVTERTIVRLDKKARLSRATQSAVFAIARKHKDVKFKKLLTLWRLERQIEAYLNKRYGNEARRMAKKSINKKSLPSGNGAHASAVRKAISVAKSQLNAHR